MRQDDTMKGRLWQLTLGGDLVTEIDQTSYEFPWIYGEVSDLDAFNQVRPYFRDPDEWPDTSDFAALMEIVNRHGGFALHDTRDSVTYRSFTLNADHEPESAAVWFRHNSVEELNAEADTV